MGWPRDQFNPLQFFLGFLIYGVVFNWFHEFFHLATAQMLGGNGVVKNLWYVFVADINPFPDPTWARFLVYLMGGWGVALLLWFFWLIDTDIEDRIVFHAIGWAQFAYGTVEGFSWMLGIYKHIQPLGLVALWGATIYALMKSKKMWT